MKTPAKDHPNKNTDRAVHYVMFPWPAQEIPAAHCELYTWLLKNVYHNDEVDDRATGRVYSGRQLTVQQLAGKVGLPLGTVKHQKDGLLQAGLLRVEGTRRDPRGMIYYVRSADNWDCWEETARLKNEPSKGTAARLKNEPRLGSKMNLDKVQKRAKTRFKNEPVYKEAKNTSKNAAHNTTNKQDAGDVAPPAPEKEPTTISGKTEDRAVGLSAELRERWDGRYLPPYKANRRHREAALAMADDVTHGVFLEAWELWAESEAGTDLLLTDAKPDPATGRWIPATFQTWPLQYFLTSGAAARYIEQVIQEQAKPITLGSNEFYEQPLPAERVRAFASITANEEVAEFLIRAESKVVARVAGATRPDYTQLTTKQIADLEYLVSPPLEYSSRDLAHAFGPCEETIDQFIDRIRRRTAAGVAKDGDGDDWLDPDNGQTPAPPAPEVAEPALAGTITIGDDDPDAIQIEVTA